MKVIRSEDDVIEFDNGLEISGEGDVDCCALNWIDFEQFIEGREFPNMTDKGFLRNARIKNDGFALKDSQGVPAWAQARTSQNGYYSPMSTLFVKYKDNKAIKVSRLQGEDS